MPNYPLGVERPDRLRSVPVHAAAWQMLVLRLSASAAMVVAVTAIIGLAKSAVPPRSLEVLYMPAVLSVAVLWGLIYALGAAVASALAFDWYFLPPEHHLFFHASDVAALAVLIACALLMSQLSSRGHARARASERARGMIAEEQAALRRVATLVAREVPTSEVFEAVCAEVGALIEATTAYLWRFEHDGTATVVSSWHHESGGLPIGARISLDGVNVPNLVYETGRPQRLADAIEASGTIAEQLLAMGIRSSAGVPVTVGGHPWGAITTGSTDGRGVGGSTEERLADFTELVSTAISNSEARAELEASRTRIVAAADAERRRIERDLHDGAQQRLVALALELRGAELSLLPEQAEVRGQLDHVARELGAVLDELRRISRGIHPALLSDRGLRAAVRSIGRRSPIPVEIDAATDERFPEVVEVAAYYVVSEALVNAAKHSGASVVHLRLESDGRHLNLHVTDDGVGGADPTRGSGLVGLADRAGALGGRFSLRSPVGGGTTLLVELPLRVATETQHAAQHADAQHADAQPPAPVDRPAPVDPPLADAQPPASVAAELMPVGAVAVGAVALSEAGSPAR
jgi:signal transduction histidine kinase